MTYEPACTRQPSRCRQRAGARFARHHSPIAVVPGAHPSRACGQPGHGLARKDDLLTTAFDLRMAVGRTEAAQLCQVSVDTIKRRLRDGRFPHARKDQHDQRWSIPLQDLMDDGLLQQAGVDAMVALSSPPPAEPEATRHTSNTGATDARLADAAAENRGLRAALARAEDEITFLRSLLTAGRAA